ncbi:MAG: FtsX-like permease family protein, partial [Thermoproteota archaeon]
NGTMFSASLAEALGIKEGDSININIGENIVESRVDTILEEPLRLVDGVPLDEVEEPLIVVGLELLQQPLSVYRLVLEGNFSSDFAKRLVEISYEKALNLGVGITTQTFRSFRVCFGTGNGTRSLLIVGEFQQFASAPELLVPMGLSSLMIIITLLGSFHERQKEYSTISMFGASPGRVSLLMFVEGLSYGLIGGALGYVLSQLQVIVPTPVTLVNPYAFSPLLASLLVAVVPSMVGSLIPARKAILKVVPSRFLFKKVEEFKLFRDHAEAMIPLRIIGDTDAFVTYVSSLTKRPSPMSWGPIYMQTSLRKKGNIVKAVEMVLSYRGNRVAMYKITLLLPESPGSMIKAIAYSAIGKWGIDHKYCAREMLTALRGDLLQYVDWKELACNEQTNRAPYQQTGLFKNG